MFKFCKGILPSPRGEYEIIDLLKAYLDEKRLNVTKISRGNAWFDLGTFDQLLKGAQFVQMIQERQGLLVGSPEEASVRVGLISRAELFTSKMNLNPYQNSLARSFEVSEF